METKKEYDFREGEVMLIDKPLEWTSFDVVNKLRWKLRKKYGVKRFKVGHAGTLDPLATGLLILCTGKKTKTITELIAQDKTYTGTFLLGKTTPSFDLETEYNEELPTEHITEELIHKTAELFQGDLKQAPPVFSAKKIDGKRAYEIARQGIEIEMKKNDIFIESFTIEAVRFPEVDFKVKCSKGTYIRSLANDFGKALNSGATLIALRRTASGDFTIEQSETIEEWGRRIDEVVVD